MRLAASRSQPSRKQPNHTFIKSSNTTFKLARSLRVGTVLMLACIVVMVIRNRKKQEEDLTDVILEN